MRRPRCRCRREPPRPPLARPAPQAPGSRRSRGAHDTRGERVGADRRHRCAGCDVKFFTFRASANRRRPFAVRSLALRILRSIVRAGDTGDGSIGGPGRIMVKVRTKRRLSLTHYRHRKPRQPRVGFCDLALRVLPLKTNNLLREGLVFPRQAGVGWATSRAPAVAISIDSSRCIAANPARSNHRLRQTRRLKGPARCDCEPRGPSRANQRKRPKALRRRARVKRCSGRCTTLTFGWCGAR